MLSDYYHKKDIMEKGFKCIENKTFFFFGVFNNCFKIDDMILEILEDPADGYRSHMGGVCHYKGYNDLKPRFFNMPLAKIIIEQVDEYTDEYKCDNQFDGWHLRDVSSSHIWLTFGTEAYDNYYPCFRFHYTPKTDQTKFIKIPKGYIPFKKRYPELIFKHPEWFGCERIDYEQY